MWLFCHYGFNQTMYKMSAEAHNKYPEEKPALYKRPLLYSSNPMYEVFR